MLTSDVVRLICQALAGALLLADAAEWYHLAAIALVYGTADAFFTPAVYGLMPEIVPPGQLQQANAVLGVVAASGLVSGPAVAGLLVVAVGAGGALLVDAATFAASVACLARLRKAVAARAAEPRQNFWRGLKEGWDEVRARSWVKAMLVGLAVYHLVVLPSVFAIGPVLADEELGGAGAWAAITVGFGVGSVAGQVLLLRWRPPRAIRASAACLVVACCQAAIIGSGLPVVAIAVLEGVCGVAVTCYFTLWETSVQEHIPPKAVSRVGSYDLFVATGFLPIGTAIAGPLAAEIGLHETLVGMSAIGVVVALLVFTVPAVRALTRPVARP